MHAAPGSARRDWRTGLRFIFKSPLLLSALTLDMFAVLMGGAVALLPVYAKDILNAGPQELGLLRAAPGVGAIATQADANLAYKYLGLAHLDDGEMATITPTGFTTYRLEASGLAATNRRATSGRSARLLPFTKNVARTPRESSRAPLTCWSA